MVALVFTLWLSVTMAIVFAWWAVGFVQLIVAEPKFLILLAALSGLTLLWRFAMGDFGNS